MKRSLAIGLLCLSTPATALAAPAPPEGPAGEKLVTMPGRLFAPGAVSLLVGEQVRWRNADNTAHQVKADDASFESRRLAPGDEFAQGFRQPGRFTYHCTLHRFMRGRVEVASIALTGPDRPLRSGGTAQLVGRVPAGTGTVTLERLESGGGVAVQSAVPDAEGAFSFTLRADAPARYRAQAGTLSSLVVAVDVAPSITLSARRTGRTVLIDIGTSPAQPGALVRLERHERERFGFVSLRRARLGRDSTARLRLRTRRRLRLRALLARPTGGYARGHSPQVVVPRHGRARPGRGHR